jgi:16S rRNA (cytidine1402-2'-O)-methyltransferase
MARDESSHHNTGLPRGEAAGAETTAGIALNPGLYVVATPIGNLGDITARAVAVLRGVDLIACEDTRVTGALLHRFGIATRMIPYHDYNAEKVRPRLVAQLAAGGRIALVSDAGTPLISDPGYKLVRTCADAKIAVMPVPGPSALLAALVAAGLPTNRVMFAGFLAQKAGARRADITSLKDLAATLVIYESARRLAATLADLAAILGPRPAAVCRELTKLHEEIRRGDLAELAGVYGRDGPPRGEIVIVVGGVDAHPTAAEDLDAALKEALATMSVRDAADLVAQAFAEPRRRIYRRALELANDASP